MIDSQVEAIRFNLVQVGTRDIDIFTEAAEKSADGLSREWARGADRRYWGGLIQVESSRTEAHVLHQVGIFREEINTCDPAEVLFGRRNQTKFLAGLRIFLVLVDRQRYLRTVVGGGAVQEYAVGAVCNTRSTVIADAAGLLGPEYFRIIPGSDGRKGCKREIVIDSQVEAIRLNLVQVGTRDIDIFPSVCGGVVSLRIE